MSFWLLVRMVAGLTVAAAAVMTWLTVRHFHDEPLGGVFSKWFPLPADPRPMTQLPEVGADLGVADPGTRILERARELLAIGELEKARDRLRTLVSIYPRSAAAPAARRMVGEMNLDQLLSPTDRSAQTLYEVVRGDSFLGIASRWDTNVDLIMYLNGLTRLDSLQPGQELWVMPLNFRLRIEPGYQWLSLWDGGEFVKGYPLQAVVGGDPKEGTTTIERKLALRDGRHVGMATPEYRSASKMLSLAGVPRVIAAMPESGDAAGSPKGFYLRPADMEELALLTRVGNEVEIRPASR